jgi:hypothetical protein
MGCPTGGTVQRACDLRKQPPAPSPRPKFGAAELGRG